MNSITFTITKNEIKNVAKKYSMNEPCKKQFEEILCMVENDSVLWGDIENSIRDAIQQVKKPIQPTRL